VEANVLQHVVVDVREPAVDGRELLEDPHHIREGDTLMVKCVVVGDFFDKGVVELVVRSDILGVQR